MKNKKSLVVYFSRSGNNYFDGKIKNIEIGNTEVIAKMINDYVRGDMFRIEEENPYPADYNECTKVAKMELQENSRPKLKASLSDVSSYEVIYVGYPNWWSTAPMPIFTFLEQYDLANKIIIPFCTHGGSRLGNSVTDIKKSCPNSRVMNAIAIVGSDATNSLNEVQAWIDNM